MKAVLEIKDSKAAFVMELLDNFSFVKVRSIHTLNEDDALEYEQLKNVFLSGSKRSMSHHINKFIE